MGLWCGDSRAIPDRTRIEILKDLIERLMNQDELTKLRFIEALGQKKKPSNELVEILISKFKEWESTGECYKAVSSLRILESEVYCYSNQSDLT